MSTVGKTKRLSLVFASIIFLATSSLSLFAGHVGASNNAGLGSADTYNYYTNQGPLIIGDLTQNLAFDQSNNNKNSFSCTGSVKCDQNGAKISSLTVSASDCSVGTLTINTSNTSNPTYSTSKITIFDTNALKTNKYGMTCKLAGTLTGVASGTAPGSPGPATGTQPASSTQPAATSSTSSTPTCEESAGVLDWVFCGLYSALNSITGLVLNDFIMPELKISPLCISSTGGPNCIKGDPTYQIWSSFRIYGDIILVIALLVVVISEAMGGGLIDAYSVRKILPRILVAGILLNLSIYVVAGLIDITNIIGGSIGAVITEPLKSNGAFVIHPNGEIALAGWLAVGIIGGATVLGGGAFHLLPHIGALFSSSGSSMLVDGVLVPALLIFLGILLTIVIRKTAIIALIILSPLAFAFYVLPNTQKLFKRWWDLLLEMLMVYPIIVLIFAVSSVMSVLITLPSDGNTSLQGAINSLLALVFTILPLALIPFSFKIAGDTIGRLSGLVDGGRSHLSKMGQNRRQRSREAYSTKLAGEKTNVYGRLSNTAYGKKLASGDGAFKVLGRGYRRHAEQSTQGVTLAAASVTQQPGWKTVEHNDSAQVALSNNGNYDKTWRDIQRLNGGSENMSDEKAQETAKTAILAARTAVGFGRAQAIAGARQRVVNGTGYADAAQMQETISVVSAGDESLRWSLAGDFNAVTKQVGRHDLAGSVGHIKEMSDLYQASSSGRGAEIWKDTGRTVDQNIEEGKKKSAVNGWGSGTLGQHATNKAQDIKNPATEFSKMLLSDNEADQNAAIKFYEEIKGTRNYPYASDDFINEVNKALGKQVQVTDASGQINNVSIEKFVEDRLISMRTVNPDRWSGISNSIRRADNRPPTDGSGAPTPGGTPPSDPPPATS